MALPTKDEIRDRVDDTRNVPIGWDGEVSLVANRDLFERLALDGYTADQIGRLSVAEAKALVGDDIATLAEIDSGVDVLDPANSRPSDREGSDRRSAAEVAVEAIQSVKDQAEDAAKSAKSSAGSKSSSSK